MGTQLIMTVGTNALPVWVAWYHLKHKLDQPKVRFIFTDDTESQKDLLVQHCGAADFGSHIKTSPGNPGTVRGDIRQRILNGLDEETTHLHVHYTSGTKVMGVETVSAIEKRLSEMSNVTLDTTYLDPRGNKGPCLRSRRGVISPSDARQNVEPDIERIARLNGFTPAPFDRTYWDRVIGRYNHEYWDRNRGADIRKYLPAPARLDQNQKQEGSNVLNIMNNWNHPTINPTNFEYAAYVALKQALKGIETTNSKRSNYKVYHKVYVKRTGANIRDAEFELDVVAVLGYQIVVVSCTLETGSAAIKEKGMEVILRARQLGGDEAQTIVLCKGRSDIAQRVEKGLHDEIGSASYPLQIWGTDKWRNLQDQFTNYLENDLHWR